MENLNQNRQHIQPILPIDAAKANDIFEHFVAAGTIKTIFGYYRNLCELLHLKPNLFSLFYPKLKSNLNSWKAKALWKKFDVRAAHKCYSRGKACSSTRVLIIGAGPCGLRTAIEAQLLGAKVVVIEKRDRMSRNNVLHLWPFVIEDLRALGAKKFFGKFCAGAIDHISIRQLQVILLKVALLLGVEIHTEVSFEKLIEPNNNEKIGWRAEFKPSDHPVSQYEFDVVIGADGKRNTLQGFTRNEFRGKLAIAITANFINKRTEAEARVEEISGVAFIFNQKFFKELNAETGIDLENIVYYKDDTHYFVMTAKKHSLIEKGVIIQDYSDTLRLLSPDNVDRNALLNYAREAAEFSTNYQMPDLEFAVNHYGRPDVAMFDFTSMYAAETASKVIERHGYKLLMILVGDSLLEPFWPTGSGCARGFLSSLDACWAIKAWGSGLSTPLEVMAERESIYRLLAQTTPENLNKDCKSYTLDPSTRYPNLNKAKILPQQVLNQYDSDNPSAIELVPRVNKSAFTTESHRKRRRKDLHLDPNALISWIQNQVKEHEDLIVQDLTTSFKDGRVLCAILHHYRPDLLDYSLIKAEDVAKNNQLAFDLLERELGISPFTTGEEMAKTEIPDYLCMFAYLTQIFDTFRGEIPHIKHPKLIPSPAKIPRFASFTKSHAIPSNGRSKMLILKLHRKLFPDLISKLEASDIQNKTTYTSSAKDINNAHKSDMLNPLLEETQLNLLPLNNSVIDNTESKNICEETDKSSNIVPSSIITSTNQIGLEEIHKEELCSNEKENCISEIQHIDSNLKINLDSDQRIDKSVFSMYNESKNMLEEPTNVHEESSEKTKKVQDSIQEKTLVFNYTPVKSIEEYNHYKRQFASDETNKCKALNKVANSIEPAVLHDYDSNLLDCNDKLKRIHSQEFFGQSNTSSNLTILNNNFTADAISPSTIVVRYVDQEYSELKIQEVKINLTANELIVKPQKTVSIREKCHKTEGQHSNVEHLKFLSQQKMSDQEVVPLENTYNRIVDWINLSNFREQDGISDACGDAVEGYTDITSVTKNVRSDLSGKPPVGKPKPPKEVKTEICTEVQRSDIGETVKDNVKLKTPEVSSSSLESMTKFTEKLRKGLPSIPKPAWAFLKSHSKSEPPLRFTTISEKDEKETPEPREQSKDKIKLKCPLSLHSYESATALVSNQSGSRSKIVSETFFSDKPTTTSERKTKKRKSFDKSEKSVDHENRSNHVRSGGTQEELAARIKNLEDKWQDQTPLEKRPRDLNRAIGKIETSDWNIKEIAKKIKENKLGKPVNKEKERVPKWNKDQFVARQTKMERQHYDRQNSAEVKFSELDRSIKKLEQRLKEGSVRDLGTNKVAAITEKLIPKTTELDVQPILKPNFKPPVSLLSQTNFENCHFCQKRVYLMERLCAEGRFFHRGCFKCQYCHASLRLGSYMFDRDGQYGNRFYCSQHYGLPGEISSKVDNKLTNTVIREHAKPLEKLKIPLLGIENVDLLDRVQTPERVEFANLSAGNISSDHEESISQMDEDEWTDRNFGASTAELHTSDDDEDSSSLSGSESDNEDAYEEAVEEPPTKEGTLKWMERYKQRYSKGHKHKDNYSDEYSSSSDHYYENTSGDDDDDPVTESEEEIRARELRKQEVKLQPPVVQTDTGSDTEIVSDESSPESSSSKHNSATEISTDSEFAVDDPTPTREIPSIILNDFYVTKSRGQYITPKKVQVKSGILRSPINGKTQKCDKKLEFTPLVPSPVLPKPAPTSLPVRNDGYALNRTQSTGGIATKVSLELKKKYLLGDDGSSRNIQKSGSVATLDSVFKSFHSNISDCQKLLKPSSEISPSKQIFSDRVNNGSTSPLSPIISRDSPLKSPEQLDLCKLNSNLNLANANNIFSSVKKASELSDVTVSHIPSRNIVLSKDVPNGQNNRLVLEVAATPVSKSKEIEISSDSLTLDSDSDQHTGIHKTIGRTFNIIPRVEVHDDAGEILANSGDDAPLDSLHTIPQLSASVVTNNILSETSKSIASDKKTLNQPKILPGLQKDFHFAKPYVDAMIEHDNTRESTPSEHDSYVEHTEMSDWARDSDDFDDVEFELNPDLINTKKNRKASNTSNQHKQTGLTKKPQIDDFNITNHVCGKEKPLKDVLNKFSDIMGSIEFMDTGEETSSDEKILLEAALKNNGYVEFLNDDDIAIDSLNPCINVIPVVNPQLEDKIILENLSTNEKNTGYCILENENLDSENNGLKTEESNNLNECLSYNNEDSLLCLDVAPATEENTASDSTVKNFVHTVLFKDDSVNTVILANDQLEEANQHQPLKIEHTNSYILETPNSKQEDNTEKLAPPDLIREEMLNVISISPLKTPKNIYIKEEIKKVRDENQKLVQEIVMNKMKAENKSLERKKHIRSSYSPNRSFDLCKSITMDIGQICKNKEVTVYATPDVLLSSNCKISKPIEIAKASDLNNVTPVSKIKHRPISLSRQLSIHSSFQFKPENCNVSSTVINSDALSLPDIQQALNKDNTDFSKEISNKSIKKSLDVVNDNKLVRHQQSIEKLENHIRGNEKENINIYVQDSIESLVINTEKRNSLLYCNDTLTKKRVKSGDFSNLELTKKLSVLQPVRTKSVTEISKPYVDHKIKDTDIIVAEQLCKSDPNLLTKDYTKMEKKSKSKDRERRKSISKLISDFFSKKKDMAKNGSSPKGFLSRIAPKSKSKSMINLNGKMADEDIRPIARSLSGSALPSNWRAGNNVSPPPIPPLPLNYSNTEPVCYSDDSSEHDYKQQHSCVNVLEQGRRSSRSVRKAARQAQLKRHRIAQEIQRKLEETEVKTRDLERRGVLVEKELRGEINSTNNTKEDTELLKEWFALMHDLTDLRRYERELIVRAQEVELEDRHARLQQELRERLDNGDHKTKEDIKTERSIINEMLEIVAKRDCLISLLEKDRIRYSEEDRDFEEQMAAKGLTPQEKTPNKQIFS